jgi:cytoskeletal protein CcmA (bactofilin family)
VSVDQADIQGKIFENIEAKICLSLRKTGRIEGSATYGDIEIEKGGVLSGDVSTIKGGASSQQTSPTKVQGNLPPPQVVSSNPNPAEKTNLESNKLGVAGGQGGQRPPLFNPDNKK